MKQVVMRHVREGGTGVTNFQLKKLATYQEAVRVHGDPELIVLSQSFAPAPLSYGGSLHYLNDTGKFDLSDFWRVYERVEQGIPKCTPTDAYDRAMGIIK